MVCNIFNRDEDDGRGVDKGRSPHNTTKVFSRTQQDTVFCRDCKKPKQTVTPIPYISIVNTYIVPLVSMYLLFPAKSEVPFKMIQELHDDKKTPILQLCPDFLWRSGTQQLSKS